MELKMIGMILLICGEIIVIGSAYQQCNIICDEDHIPSPSLPNVGLPGKAGPQGEAGDEGPQGKTGGNGEKGEAGEKGPQGKTGGNGEKGEAGESCECSSMNDIREEMTALKKELQRLTSKEIHQTCQQILQHAPSSTDGVYTIQINRTTTINVYCDMTGGGWTVFQKRFDGSENFTRNFNEYSEGFGDPSQEHWIGLNNIHQLTSQPGRWILRVDLETFEGETAYAQYEDFNVGAGTNYTLSVGSYSGNAGSSMTSNNGQRFSTYDRDQDIGIGDCSDLRNGAWWFGACGSSNLNGFTFNDARHSKGMFWFLWKNSYLPTMKKTTMKMKTT